MKKLYFLFTFLIAFVSNGQDMIITGAFDGPLTGGIPKGIELYVINDIADLSIYGVSSANNGGGATGAPEFVFPADAISAGSFIYVASEDIEFANFFGFAPNYTSGAMGINGDDAIELFLNGSVIDVFGDVNTDGSGTAWDYVDGWSYRNNNTGPDGSTFVLSNWSFSGINATDGCTTNNTCSSVFPIGTFTYTPSSDPTLTMVGAPSSGSTVELGPENLTGDLEFSTTNFTVDIPSGGDGYIVWELYNETDMATHDSGSVFDTSMTYPISLNPNKTYTFTAELVDNSGASLTPAVIYTLTIITFGYNTVADIAALRADVDANGEGLYYEITGASLVTHTDSYQNRQWIQDNNIAGILIYDAGGTSTTYTVGDNVTGLKGQTEISNGVLRFIPTTDSGVIASSGNPVTPQIVTIAALNASPDDYESELVELQNVSFVDGDGVTTFSTGTNYDVTDGSNTIVKRTDFFGADYIGELIPSVNLNLVAISGEFNGTAQIYLRNLADITLSNRDFNISNFNLFPNPTSTGFVNIVSTNSSPIQVKVFDILGKQVKNETINSTLNVSGLKSGIYILNITQEGHTVTKKLVID